MLQHFERVLWDADLQPQSWSKFQNFRLLIRYICVCDKVIEDYPVYLWVPAWFGTLQVQLCPRDGHQRCVCICSSAVGFVWEVWLLVRLPLTKTGSTAAWLLHTCYVCAYSTHTTMVVQHVKDSCESHSCLSGPASVAGVDAQLWHPYATDRRAAVATWLSHWCARLIFISVCEDFLFDK